MRVALVTGSARGLGRGVARELKARGAHVHVVRRSPADRGLEGEFPGRVHQADLAGPEDGERLVQEVVKADGQLDIVVHAVGPYLLAPLSETSAADLRRLVAGNFESAFYLTQATRAAVRSTTGAYVFFGCSGVESLRARKDAPAYVVAKTALLAYVRSLALEEAPFGVRANMVSPGVIPHEDASDDTLDPELQGRIPMGAPGRVEDIARAVCWLASDEAGHVTGQNLDVAGGWMM
ncbi:MAG: SDR family oxidoreductase [bacterium]|nr:SDR family oxidoreductase [bacterium]